MSLFAELKRRNVIRMAGLYLVGAWLITQVAGTVLPMFGAPDWIARSVVVLLAIGLVPALVVSWAFELTPQGLKRDEDVLPQDSIAPLTAQRMNRLLLAVSVLALVYFAVDKFVLAPRRDAALVAQTTAHVAAEASAEKSTVNPRSIAVLPFVNMSDDKENAYFSDGISEELLNVLVRVNDFSVASRTSSFAYKDKEVGTGQIASELKVRYVLEGSVRKQGDHVRITAQLIDGSDDRHLWSETYDRKLADIFAIQDEIANAIVAELRGTVGTGKAEKVVTVRADTTNLGAYEAYLKARELFIARTDLKESIRLFEHVVELDPKFARGWEGLAAVYSVAPSWLANDRDYVQLAETAAHRALELDPSLSMPWAALGLAAEWKLPVDWAPSLAQLDRGIAADPKNATALLWRSIAWDALGFFQRALDDQERCLAVDPAYQNCVRWKAMTLMFTGNDAPALELFERGVAAGFTRNRADTFAQALLRRGDRIGARLLLKELGAAPELIETMLAAVSRPGGTVQEADAIVHRYVSDPYSEFSRNFGDSKIYFWLGAFDKVATARDLSSESLETWDPARPDFRNTPGFKQTLIRLGVVEYWRKQGWPPQCRAVGAEDFTCDVPTLKVEK